jgi:hypothetical protein
MKCSFWEGCLIREWGSNLFGRNWRRGPGSNRRIKVLQTSPLPLGYRALAGQPNCCGSPLHRSQSGRRRRVKWSGRRDLNSRPSPWQGDALPLSYSRLVSQFRVYRSAQNGSNRGAGSCGRLSREVGVSVSAVLDAHNLAVAHVQDPVRNGRRFRVVRDHQHGLAQLAIAVQQHI